jgi:hypothetical protein
MIARLRRLAAFLCLALAAALPARATSYSVDFTDIWWNAAESGWGLNVIQQQELLFVTLYHYGADNSPRWFVASGLAPVTPQPAGLTRFTGTLYQTAGPYYGLGSFNPASVTTTPVGTMTLSFNSPSTGTLSYTISGTSVTKDITRYGFRTQVVTGLYVGGMYAIATNCPGGTLNGPSYITGLLTVTQGAEIQGVSAVTINNVIQTGVSCVYNGQLTSLGRTGTISGGTWQCTSNGTSVNRGTFTMTGLDTQVNQFSANFIATDTYNSCTYTGRFGGMRDVVSN